MEIEIDLPDEQWAYVEQYALEHGISENEAFHEVLNQAWERWDALPEEERQRQVQAVKDARA